MNSELKLRDFPWWYWSLEDCELSYAYMHMTTHTNVCEMKSIAARLLKH